MNQKTLKTYSVIITTSFYLVILVDFLTKIILTYNNNLYYRYSAVPKAVINVLLLIIVLKQFNYNKQKYILLYFIMISLSFIGYILLYPESNIDDIIKHIYISLLYSSFFILVTFFSLFPVETRHRLLDKLIEAIINVGIICCLLMLVGMFTEIELFRSYDYSKRFGYNGIFLKTSEASYYFMFLIIISYYKLKQNKKFLYLFILFIIFSLFIGTKVIWLFLSLFMLFLVFKKNKVLSILIIAISIMGYFIFKTQIDSSLVSFFPNGERFYNYNGIYTILTSTRDLLLERTLSFINERWTILNYLFGGNRYTLFKVEFELFDIFSLFGFFGVFIYLLFIKKFFFQKNMKFNHIFLLIIILICTLFAGNFFKSFICTTLFYTVFENYRISCKSKNIIE